MQTLSSQSALAGCYVNDEDKDMLICNGLDVEHDLVVEIIQEGGLVVQELTHKLLA